MSSGVNVETEWPHGEPAETPLSAPNLRAHVDRTDAFPSLILEDGERVVEISTAIGPRAQSAGRLTELAAIALALAEELRINP